MADIVNIDTLAPTAARRFRLLQSDPAQEQERCLECDSIVKSASEDSR